MTLCRAKASRFAPVLLGGILLTFILQKGAGMDQLSGRETTTAGSGEVAWRRSSHSNYTGSCVEVADLGGSIAVRDSKAGPSGATLRFGREVWAVFLAGVKGDIRNGATDDTDSPGR